jgi:plastocyanin
VSWLAILLTLASLGGNPAPGEVKPRKQCTGATKQKAAKAKDCKPKKKTKGKTKKAKPKKSPTTNAQPRAEPAPGAPGAQPEATPAPPVTPGATATPVPTATPTYPKRTNVDLDEWFVRPSYRTLAAGPIDFNANNKGEDDHNLAVRGGGREYGKLDVPPGESDVLTLTLGAGSYTLYCSLPDHEAAGMSANINVR